MVIDEEKNMQAITVFVNWVNLFIFRLIRIRYTHSTASSAIRIHIESRLNWASFGLWLSELEKFRNCRAQFVLFLLGSPKSK